MVNLNWNDKDKMLSEINNIPLLNFKYCEEESKDFYGTNNLYIEGDNLYALKYLEQEYTNKIKMIYIDPPYNTGKDFIYKDKFHKGKECKHSNWLNMIYPRLKIAHNLLKEDGVIFISIDDNEVHNLRKVCDEIFGEHNFVAQFIWQKTYSPKNNNKYVSEDHEYILCFAKNLNSIKKFYRLERTEKSDSFYNKDDNDGKGLYRLDNLTIGNQKGYNIIWDGKIYKEPETRGWAFSEEKMYELIKEGRIYLPEDENKRPQYKRYLTEVEGIISKTILTYEEVGHTDSAKKFLNELLGNNIFDYPKPIKLIERCLKLITKEDDIILDFFSGSATTAHSVMKLNAEDGGNRKFILVQIPEKCDEKSEAYKNGFKNICEIGKERIRRAGEKIKEDFENNNSQISFDENSKKLPDIGFKVLKRTK